MSKYFTPIDAGGIVRFIQGATAAGWYQLNRPGLINTALPGIVVPAECTGMLIQAEAPLTFAYSPQDALAGITYGLDISTGSSMFVPGYEFVNQWCVLLPASGAQFSIQFYQGGIGPLPTQS